MYNHREIETKWQKTWAKNNYELWHAGNLKPRAGGRKLYVLDMFPYPSGSGLHVGHLLGYIGSDVASRYYRTKGLSVLHPMGWDAFGLPAENYAIKNKIHPAEAVKKNIGNFKQELSKIGFSYDWQREINTTDPKYYKWTQWIFLQMFKKGLAYESEAPVNWCLSCKTILANEEIADGKCDRCQNKVERRKLRQWILKITAYADRLLKGLEKLDWPEKVKEMQRNWIGRSEGRTIKFSISNSKFSISVFTTRPDTIDGATYVVFAPEHPLIALLRDEIKNWKELSDYIAQAEKKSERERIMEGGEKTGVQIKGVKAINPHNKQELPIWVSDYVLGHYGTGAIMAVPAHDERDREFAKKFKLPIKDKPLVPKKKWVGEAKVNYKLRDWIFSRQRYWGEPIPLVFCESCKKLIENHKLNFPDSKEKLHFNDGELLSPGWIAIPEKDLPLELPKVKSYEPTGKAESPLAGIKSWVNTTCPKCGGPAKRETNTMPQWAGSSWYYLAYTTQETLNSQFSISNYGKIFKFWLPVDLYIGGIEHAVLHLLYARFWHKFLYDIGVVPVDEPFQKLINQGIILGADNQKMSKSRGNVVSPDVLVKEFGADSLRIYELFMGPFGDSKPWDPQGIVGAYRFLNRVYGLAQKTLKNGVRGGAKSANGAELERSIHKTIKKVSEDVENFRFNTAISALMVLVNEMERESAKHSIKDSHFLILAKLLSPFAPHLAQELWKLFGKKTLLDYEKWPKWDEKLVIDDRFDLVIQINGRVRGTVTSKTGITQKEAQDIAKKHLPVKKWLVGKKIKKAIFVPDKLINLIVVD